MKKKLLFGMMCLIVTVFPNLLFGQNSTCATAALLTIDSNCGGSATGPGANSGDPTGNDDTDGNVCSTNYSDGDDFIFEYTATSTDALELDLYATNTWTGLMVTEGCPTTGVCIASSTSSSSDESLTTPALSIGLTYYIHISTFPSPQSPGEFCLDAALVSPPMPPVNDECTGAIPVLVNADESCTLVSSGTIELATASPEDDTACSGTEDDDVWFSFVATSTVHTIDLLNLSGGTTDLYHSLWEGTCGSLTHQGLCSDPNSSIASGLTIGNTYYVRVYSWTSTTGQTTDFDICIGTPPPPPVNDLCLTATPYLNDFTMFAEGACSGTPNTINLSSATDDIGNDDPSCDSFSPNIGVWYTWTATSTGLTFDSGTGLPGLAVFESGTCGSLTEVGCINNADGVITGLTIGNDYIFYIWDDTSPGLEVSFCLEEYTPPSPPANDECTGAIALTLNPDETCTSFASGTVASSTASPEDDTACGGTEDDDVWFSFTATSTVHLIELFNVSGSTTDLYHSLWEGTCGSLTHQGLCSDPNSSVASGLTIGNTYYIRVYTWTATSGQNTTFDICVGTPPPPPDCSSSTIMICGNTYNTGDLSGTGAWNPDISDDCFPTPGKEIVFQYLVENDGDHELEISLSSGTSSWNDYYYRTDGVCEETGWTCLGDIATSATLDIPGLTSGQTLYILVDSETTGAGRIHDIVLNCPPPPIAAGTTASCTTADGPATSTGSGQKMYITHGGDVVAAFIDSEAMGTVDASFFVEDATDMVTRDYNNAGAAGDGYDLIDRSIVITPTAQPTNPVNVFLYFTDDEFNELTANTDGDNATVGSWSDVGITKFSTDDCADMVNPQDLTGELATFIGATAITGGWEVEIQVNSFSGFQAAEGGAALPVTLERFTAKADGRHNMIEWTTATEIDVQDHTVLRSTDNNTWEVLGVVDGYDHSTSEKAYTMVDFSPATLTYYRLLTTDIDGSESYSAIVSVVRDENRSSEFMGASPVPTADIVNLKVYTQDRENLQITVMDVSGKIIQQLDRSLEEGEHQLPVDLSNAQSGIYLVMILSENISMTHRVIKN